MSVGLATMGKFSPAGFGVGGGGGAPPIRSIAEERKTPSYIITIDKVYFEESKTTINVKLLENF